MENHFYLDVAAEVELDESGCQIPPGVEKKDNVLKSLSASKSPRFTVKRHFRLPKNNNYTLKNRHNMLGNLTFREIAEKRKGMLKKLNKIKRVEGISLNSRIASLLGDSTKKDLGKSDGLDNDLQTIDPQMLVGRTIKLLADTPKNITIKFVSQNTQNHVDNNEELLVKGDHLKENSQSKLLTGGSVKNVSEIQESLQERSQDINGMKEVVGNKAKEMNDDVTNSYQGAHYVLDSAFGSTSCQNLTEMKNKSPQINCSVSQGITQWYSCSDSTELKTGLSTTITYIDPKTDYTYKNDLVTLSEVASERFALSNFSDHKTFDREKQNILVCNSFEENSNKSQPLETVNSTVSRTKTSIEKKPTTIAENLNSYDLTFKSVALKKNQKRKVAHIFAWCTQYTTDNIVDKKTPVRESTRKVNSDFQKNNNIKEKSIKTSPRPLKNNISKLLKHTSPLKPPGKDKCNQEVLDKNPEKIKIDLVKHNEKLLNVKDDDVILLKEVPAQQDNKLYSTDNEVIFLEEIHGTNPHHKDTKESKVEDYGNKSRDMSGKSKMPHTVALKNNRHPLLNKLIKNTQENRTCTNKYKERLRTCSKSDPQYVLPKSPKSCEKSEVRTKSMIVNNNTNSNQLRIASNIINPESKITSSSLIKSKCIKGTKPQYRESLKTISDDLKTKTYHKMSPSDKSPSNKPLCSDKSDGSSHTGMYRKEELISSLKIQDTNPTIVTCEDLYGRNKLNLRSCYVLLEKLDLPKQNLELNCQNAIITSNGTLNSNTKSVSNKSTSESQLEISFSKSKQTEENKCSVQTDHVLGISIKEANDLSSSHLKNLSPLDNKLQINKTMKRDKKSKTPNIFQQWIDFYKSNKGKSNCKIFTKSKVHKKVSAVSSNVEEVNCESYENKSLNIKRVMFKSDSSEGDIRKAIKRGIQTSKHNVSTNDNNSTKMCKRGIQTSKHNVSTNDNNSTKMCEHQVSQHIPTIKRPRIQLRKSSYKRKHAQGNENQLIIPLKTNYELRSYHSPTVNCKKLKTPEEGKSEFRGFENVPCIEETKEIFILNSMTLHDSKKAKDHLPIKKPFNKKNTLNCTPNKKLNKNSKIKNALLNEQRFEKRVLRNSRKSLSSTEKNQASRCLQRSKSIENLTSRKSTEVNQTASLKHSKSCTNLKDPSDFEKRVTRSSISLIHHHQKLDNNLYVASSECKTNQTKTNQPEEKDEERNKIKFEGKQNIVPVINSRKMKITHIKKDRIVNRVQPSANTSGINISKKRPKLKNIQNSKKTFASKSLYGRQIRNNMTRRFCKINKFDTNVSSKNRSLTFSHGQKKKPVNNMPCKVIEQGKIQDIKLGEASRISETFKDNMSQSKQISIMKDKNNMPSGSCELSKEHTDYDVTEVVYIHPNFVSQNSNPCVSTMHQPNRESFPQFPTSIPVQNTDYEYFPWNNIWLIRSDFPKHSSQCSPDLNLNGNAVNNYTLPEHSSNLSLNANAVTNYIPLEHSSPCSPDLNLNGNAVKNYTLPEHSSCSSNLSLNGNAVKNYIPTENCVLLNQQLKCEDVSRADNMKIHPFNRTCDYDCKNCNNLQLENSDSSSEGGKSSDLEVVEEKLSDNLHRILQCAKSRNQSSAQKWKRKCSRHKDNMFVCSTPVSIDPKVFERIDCVQDIEYKSAKEPKTIPEYSRLPLLREIETPDKDEPLKLRLNDFKRRRLKKTISWPDISRSCQNKMMPSLDHCVNSTCHTKPDESSAENKSVSSESFTAEETRSRLTTEEREVFYNKLNCSETECVPETNQPCDSVEGKYTRHPNRCSVSERKLLKIMNQLKSVQRCNHKIERNITKR